jgi:hypothetical protein
LAVEKGMSRQNRSQQGGGAVQEERSNPGPGSRGLGSVVDVPMRLRADTEDQIRLLAELDTAIHLANRDL